MFRLPIPFYVWLLSFILILWGFLFHNLLHGAISILCFALCAVLILIHVKIERFFRIENDFLVIKTLLTKSFLPLSALEGVTLNYKSPFQISAGLFFRDGKSTLLSFRLGRIINADDERILFLKYLSEVASINCSREISTAKRVTILPGPINLFHIVFLGSLFLACLLLPFILPFILNRLGLPYDAESHIVGLITHSVIYGAIFIFGIVVLFRFHKKGLEISGQGIRKIHFSGGKGPLVKNFQAKLKCINFIGLPIDPALEITLNKKLSFGPAYRGFFRAVKMIQQFHADRLETEAITYQEYFEKSRLGRLSRPINIRPIDKELISIKRPIYALMTTEELLKSDDKTAKSETENDGRRE